MLLLSLLIYIYIHSCYCMQSTQEYPFIFFFVKKEKQSRQSINHVVGWSYETLLWYTKTKTKTKTKNKTPFSWVPMHELIVSVGKRQASLAGLAGKQNGIQNQIIYNIIYHYWLKGLTHPPFGLPVVVWSFLDHTIV